MEGQVGRRADRNLRQLAALAHRYAGCIGYLRNRKENAMTTLKNSDSGAGSSNYEMGDTGESVRQLNSLLRGEISAAETYRMAIDKVADSNAPNAGLLREI